jgi:hypothetical protein
MRSYFYALLRRYLSLFILPRNSVVEIDPTTADLVARLPGGAVAFREGSPSHSSCHGFDHAGVREVPLAHVATNRPDYIVISGLLHYERDVQQLLSNVRDLCNPQTRLVLTYYSSLWRPLATLASRLGWRSKLPELNWLGHSDVHNLLHLEGFELVRLDHKVLLPLYLPLLSDFVNRYVAPLPLFRMFCLVNIAIARPVAGPSIQRPSVSIVVPARNEAGNIEEIIRRTPQMGPDDELIFIEGNSTDTTWQAIQAAQARHSSSRRIVIGQQAGKGKGDAVRKGFQLARNEILMILDADMTVPPEDLPKFYRAIVEDRGEFINGSRLVYPMEKRAMRFLNLLANKFFAAAFTYVLSQSFKDTLCGTKVIRRDAYEQLARNRSYFGEFDPFGDFDLIFGAARMGLKIVEVPITYRERTYGTTNISRWRHGAILLTMLAFAARKIKFV